MTEMILILSRLRVGVVVLVAGFLLGACGRGAGSGVEGPARAHAADGRATVDVLGQVVGILDYLASDYAGAVREGRVVNEVEYREQLLLVGDALTLARRRAGPDDPLVTDLLALAARMRERASPAEVRAACRALRTSIVERFGLVLAPATPPSWARARQLYAAHCTSCHGDDGSARTARALELDPRPASFLAPERMRGVSPARAFHAITFGVRNTAMAAFDVLPVADRWSLAFHVVALRHGGADLARGRARFEAARRPVAPTLTRLAQASDEELDAALRRAMPEAERADALAFLRVGAPYEPPRGGTFGQARALLARVVSELHAGARDAALRAAIAAYLDGVEPYEAALRTRDAGLAARIEGEFVALRGALSGGAPGAEVERRTMVLASLLDRAEERPRAGRSATFLGSLAIALREGIEAALLLAALLSFVRRRGTPAQARWVHGGWVAAVPAGLLTWWLAAAVMTGARREVAEGVVSLLAAVILLGVSHWMLGRRESQRWLGFLERRMGDAGSRGARWGVAALAFGAAYREAFETVLFYRALLLDADGQASAVAAGALAGLAVLAVVVVVLQRLGRRLRPRPFMLASGVVLCAMAVVFVGRGVRALQEAGLVPLRPVRAIDLPSLGLYATLEGIGVQGLVLSFLVVTALWSALGSRSHGMPPPARPVS